MEEINQKNAVPPGARSGYILALCAALVYAVQVILAKTVLVQGAAPSDLMVIQYSLSSMILGVSVLAGRDLSLFRLPKKYWFPVLLQGWIGAAATTYLMYLAMQTLNAGIASMLLYLCPVYVCGFFMITGIRKITWSNQLALAMATLGAILVLNLFSQGGLSGMLKEPTQSLQSAQFLWGLVPGLLSGIAYAFYNIYADLGLRALPTGQMLFFVYLSAAIGLWIINPGLIFRLGTEISPDLLAGAFILSLLSVIPMGLINLAIRRIGANRVSIVMIIELPFTMILAFIFLKEKMQIIQILGVLLILSALLLLKRGTASEKNGE